MKLEGGVTGGRRMAGALLGAMSTSLMMLPTAVTDTPNNLAIAR